MPSVPSAIKRFFKALREVEWITSLLGMVGLGGLITSALTGVGMTVATVLQGFVWPTVVFNSLGTMAFTVIVYGAFRQWRIGPALETPSIPTAIAAPRQVDQATSLAAEATESVHFYEDQKTMFAAKLGFDDVFADEGVEKVWIAGLVGVRIGEMSNSQLNKRIEELTLANPESPFLEYLFHVRKRTKHLDFAKKGIATSIEKAEANGASVALHDLPTLQGMVVFRHDKKHWARWETMLPDRDPDEWPSIVVYHATHPELFDRVHDVFLKHHFWAKNGPKSWGPKEALEAEVARLSEWKEHRNDWEDKIDRLERVESTHKGCAGRIKELSDVRDDLVKERDVGVYEIEQLRDERMGLAEKLDSLQATVDELEAENQRLGNQANPPAGPPPTESEKSAIDLLRIAFHDKGKLAAGMVVKQLREIHDCLDGNNPLVPLLMEHWIQPLEKEIRDIEKAFDVHASRPRTTVSGRSTFRGAVHWQVHP